MTIGPEPTMQMLCRSCLRGKLVHPFLQQRPGVVRAGSRLRMELERARAQLREGEPFDGAVIERHVRRLLGVVRAYGEPVVLARHEDAPVRALQHRMVRAAVAEGKLERLVPGGERK